MADQRPRVLVVDDVPLFRQAVREAVEKAGGDVVAEAENGRQALYAYVESSPDIVFLDIMMPKMDGIAALRFLRKYNPDARVIMCSSVRDSEMIFSAIQLGAMDFVPKPFTDERIASAMWRAWQFDQSRKDD